MTFPAGKPEWRARILAARRERTVAERAAARTAITAHLLGEIGAAPTGARSDDAGARSDGARAGHSGAAPAGSVPARPTVCAYLPLPSEPLDAACLDMLVAWGWRVLVPVTLPGEALDWAEYPAANRPGGDQSTASADDHEPQSHHDPQPRLTAPGRSGVHQPQGPRLGADAIASAQWVLVPALAVDADGIRLGRGGGYYDRSLLLASRAKTVAVVFDDEYVAERGALPAEEHDARVARVVTPSGGVRPLGSGTEASVAGRVLREGGAR